jgi:hypothetical protein
MSAQLVTVMIVVALVISLVITGVWLIVRD